MKKLFRSILLSVMLACSAFAVQASTYSFEFLSSNYEVDGTITTSGPNSLGTGDVTGITGTVWGAGGGVVTGIENNPEQPNQTSAFGFIYDNILTNDLNLTSGGILLKFGTSSRGNLFRVGQTAYRFYSYDGEGPVGVIDVMGTFTVTPVNIAPVPEPETYAMMLAGLGMLGLASRRRRQSLLATA